MPYFSIAIPTYEMRGCGVEFLEHSFMKLYSQSFKDFEVVVSDHSMNTDIQNLCNDWINKLNIKYLRNEICRGSSSANLNNAIKNSSGKWIKILFQDDFLFDYLSLENIKSKIDDDTYWLASACEHTNDGFDLYRPFYPKWNDDIDIGNNTISSPSVICIRNENPLYFDEDFIWLMDVEYYKRMYDSYGEPTYIHNITVVNRTWNGSISSQISTERMLEEKQIMISRRQYENFTESYFNKFVNLQFDKNLIYGRGIVDINEHLYTLRKYSSMCNTVTEMGTRFAISTLALIIGSPNGKVTSIDLNYHFYEPYEEETKRFADECGTNYEFIIGDVLKMDIENTDMLFIDTLHTYNQLSKELRRHESKVNKWIILHDTVTYGQRDEIFYTNGTISDEVINESKIKSGLYTALLDFLDENKNWKIKDHYENNNGLTIIERC